MLCSLLPLTNLSHVDLDQLNGTHYALPRPLELEAQPAPTRLAAGEHKALECRPPDARSGWHAIGPGQRAIVGHRCGRPDDAGAGHRFELDHERLAHSGLKSNQRAVAGTHSSLLAIHSVPAVTCGSLPAMVKRQVGASH